MAWWTYGAGVRLRLPAAVAVLVLAAACTGGNGPDRAATATSGASTTTSTTVPEGGYALGRRTIEVVDPSRPTAADPARDLPAEPDRRMDVLLLYPAEGAPSGTPVEDAPVAEGSFPLVVFSHGVTATGPTYEGRIKEWARAGYVVAAPTFPLSSGPGGQVADYVNQPGDVQAVIDELLDLSQDDPLAGHVDGENVAAAGHSLGAITTLGVGLTSCCADERIDAVVELSGVRLPFDGSGVDDVDRVPLLAVHGAQDAVVPVSGSDTLFEAAEGPAFYLRLEDAGHSEFLATDGPLVDAVVIAFLDTFLRGDEGALEEVAPLVEARGAATFEAKPGG